MIVQRLDNIFSLDQLSYIHEVIDSFSIPMVDDQNYIPSGENNGTGVAEELGRLQIGNIANSFNHEMYEVLENIGIGLVNYPVKMDHVLYTEYSNKYGKPNLPPHFDGDTNDFIINMQLSSNTSWALGLNFETHVLNDNSAMVFNGNTEIHWREHKEFKDGEYVKMLFIRFFNLEKRSDYSYVPMNQSNDIFKDVKSFRDSLKN